MWADAAASFFRSWWFFYCSSGRPLFGQSMNVLSLMLKIRMKSWYYWSLCTLSLRPATRSHGGDVWEEFSGSLKWDELNLTWRRSNEAFSNVLSAASTACRWRNVSFVEWLLGYNRACMGTCGGLCCEMPLDVSHDNRLCSQITVRLWGWRPTHRQDLLRGTRCRWLLGQFSGCPCLLKTRLMKAVTWSTSAAQV